MELKNNSIVEFLKEYTINESVFYDIKDSYLLKNTCGLKDVLIFTSDFEAYGIDCIYTATYKIEKYDDYSFMAKLDNQSIKMI